MCLTSYKALTESALYKWKARFINERRFQGKWKAPLMCLTSYKALMKSALSGQKARLQMESALSRNYGKLPYLVEITEI